MNLSSSFRSVQTEMSEERKPLEIVKMEDMFLEGLGWGQGWSTSLIYGGGGGCGTERGGGTEGIPTLMPTPKINPLPQTHRALV